jgi:hypothetical protein
MPAISASETSYLPILTFSVLAGAAVAGSATGWSCSAAARRHFLAMIPRRRMTARPRIIRAAQLSVTFGVGKVAPFLRAGRHPLCC